MQMQHFTISYGCVLAMAVLPLACAGLATIKELTTRAKEAEVNTYQALPFFFAAVIMAHTFSAIQLRLDILSLIFVLLRVLYVMVAVAGIGSLGRIIWGAAFAVNVGIFLLGVR